jgi:hypothetical protein
MRIIKLLAAALAAVCCATVHAETRPYAMQETARIALPAGAHAKYVAIEGDLILASVALPNGTATVQLYQRRSATSWTLSRTLLTFGYSDEFAFNSPQVAMEGGIAVVLTGAQIAVFERAKGWARSAVAPADRLASSDLRIDGQRIMVGSGNCGDAVIYEPDASGTWVVTANLKGTGGQCSSDGDWSGGFDLSGSYAIVPSTTADPADEPSYVFRRGGTPAQWTRVGTLPVSGLEPFTALHVLRGSVALAYPFEFRVTSPALLEWIRSGSTWTLQPELRALDSYAGAYASRGSTLDQRGAWTVQLRPQSEADLNPGNAIDVWHQATDNTFTRVAQLHARVNDLHDAAVYENRVVAATNDLANDGSDIVVFELPANLATPAPIRDDFEGGNGATWQTAGGAQFSIAAGPNGTHRYRQAATAAFATATLDASDWVNQALEAEVGQTSNTSTQGYVAVGVRWDGAASGYFARIRNDNTLQLVKRIDGIETVLGASQSARYAGRHRLQIEARDRLLTVYLDGVRTLTAFDASLKHGQAVLATSATKADFDNVYVSPLRQPLFNMDFSYQREDAWTANGGTWDYAQSGSVRNKTQLSAAGTARAITGVATGDQINEARVRADTSSTSDGSWVGVMARYVDANNLYYLSLRRSGRLLLRKLVNGVATDLKSSQPGVSASGQFHTLRLEATGDRLRAFLDGQFQFETRDSEFPTGRPAIATGNSKATFSSFVSYQP